MEIVKGEAQFKKALQLIGAARTVYFDTETTGLKPFKGDRLCGVGVGISLDQCWYFPFRHEGEFYEGGNFSIEELKELITVLGKVPVLVGFNMKFDLEILYQDGYWPVEEQQLVDVIIMSRLCVPEPHPLGGLKLETMEERFLGPGEGAYNGKLVDWLKAHKLWKSKKEAYYHQASIEVLGLYCCKDVLGTMRLKRVLQQEIVDTEQVKVWQTEVYTTKVWFEMEVRGTHTDRQYCEEAIAKVDVRAEEIEKELFTLVGKPFNINSSDQITLALNGVGIYSPVKTDGGEKGIKKQSWGKEALAAMGGDAAHPAIKLIREFKSWGTLKGTYLEVFRDAGEALHCTFKPWGAVTGRISCTDPNLQNVPRVARGTAEQGDAVMQHQGLLTSLVGEEVATRFTVVDVSYDVGEWDEQDGKMVAARRALIPRSGYELLVFDYKQMEMLVFLCYTGNKVLLKRVEEGYLRGEPIDFHDIVAEEVWGGLDSLEFKTFRQLAKGLNFGLIFGMGDKSLAVVLKTTVERTAEYRQQYFDRMPGSREFIDRVSQTAESRGYVSNFFGRRYTLEPGRAYALVNYLVQGSCADFMKDRMWRIRKALLGDDAYTLLQVHDELVLEVRPKDLMAIASVVKGIMEERVFTTPIPVDIARCPKSWIDQTAVVV